MTDENIEIDCECSCHFIHYEDEPSCDCCEWSNMFYKYDDLR